MLHPDLSRFVSEFGSQRFRHRDQLILEIELGDAELVSVCESGGAEIDELLRISERRIWMFDRLLKSEFSERMNSTRKDTIDLCDGLRRNKGGEWGHWVFSHASGGSTYVYVGGLPCVVLGCVSNILS